MSYPRPFQNLFICSLLVLTACAPKVKTNLTKISEPLAYDATVATLFPSQNSPVAEKIGRFRVGERGLTKDCGYDNIMRMARIEARRKGANVIHIERIKEPGFCSSCFTFFGTYYNVPDVYAFQDSINTLEDEISSQAFNGDSSYAMVHVYRPKGSYGLLVNYKMHLNDSTLFKVKGGTYETIRIDKQNCYRFWASTLSTTDARLCIKPGEEYFLKCGVKPGLFYGRPRITFVDKPYGRDEIKKLKIHPKVD